MPQKKKRLTKHEKALNARVKKELQDKGLLPPNKPRLNRKKFARETWAEFKTFLENDYVRAVPALLRSIGFMVGPDLPKITPEQVGILKLLKLAIEYDKFQRKLIEERRSEYTVEELADEVFLPVYKL